MIYRLTRRAQKDIRDIWSFIAQDSIDAANRVEDEFTEALELLVRFPGMGHPHISSINPHHRFWKVYSYLIVYRTSRDVLHVVRIIDGRRDLKRALK